MRKAKTTNTKNASAKMQAPGSKQAIDNMKYEIANEFGVNLGADATSRANGVVGGEMTKRLVQQGMGKSNSTTRGRKKSTNK